MLTEYRNLSWPLNLWSMIFQKEICESELPEDWEASLERVLDSLGDEKRKQILTSYFQERLSLKEIGLAHGVVRETIRHNIRGTVRAIRQPTKLMLLSRGLAECDRLLSEEDESQLVADSEPIATLGLSTRANNCLKRAGVETVGQLRLRSEKELMGIRHMGIKTMCEIRPYLRDPFRCASKKTCQQWDSQSEEKTRVALEQILGEVACGLDSCKNCECRESEAACLAHQKKITISRMLDSGLVLQNSGTWETVVLPKNFERKRKQVAKRCSICGWTCGCRYNYCPNCGAKMDLEGEDA